MNNPFLLKSIITATPTMKTQKHQILNANQAVAQIAYKTNEVCPIYPITPASEMSELTEKWSAQGKINILGSVPTAFEMQSEAGVAGAMHGALQTGSLSTTFTASQGLLLMLPNMYKIAGELTPNVIHVATRSIATHALSVFGDHSDIMAVRQSGYAFLGSASVQEAQDMALIAQAATLESRIPFVHFFDGFRTSHEINKIETISDDIIKKMISIDLIHAHRNRALNPNNPIIRGTSQGPDVFFQSREAVNPFYDACPDIVQTQMNAFAKLTGRLYKLFDYVGDVNAEHVIISMASSTETIEETIKYLNNRGEKYGLIKVRLFRPFSKRHLLEALPLTCKGIAVLDRTKEAGSSGEPLYLDVVKSISEAFQNNDIASFPKIVGGRYGLSSKEFTPSMVSSIFNNLKLKQPKNNFTVGINDDVMYLSLDAAETIGINNSNYQAVFHQRKSKTISQSFSSTVQLIGGQDGIFVQGYTECDYKKSDSRTVSHLRIDTNPIKAPYLIEYADFVACQNVNFVKSDNVLKIIKTEGILLVNSSQSSQAFWQDLPASTQYQIVEKNINLYIVNIDEIKENNLLSNNELSELHTCFLTLNEDFIHLDINADIHDYIYKVDTAIDYDIIDVSTTADAHFSNSLLGNLLANKGNDVPVSLFPVDGTYSSDTSNSNPARESDLLPEWNTELCTQCGACSMACPQAALRIKIYDDLYLEESPLAFKATKSIEADWEVDLLNYTIQINPDHCNSCNNCIDACPVKALSMIEKDSVIAVEKDNWKHFEGIPEFDRTKIDVTRPSQQQLQEPLFKYSIGVEGCGEAPYLKLMSQLYGDRLLVANATGASSIFGGALPTTPWSKNKKGQGPAWSNSLFEDNAEFGLGFRLSLNQKEQQAKSLLKKLTPKLNFDLVCDIIKAKQETDAEIKAQRQRVAELKDLLTDIDSNEAHNLLHIADSLIKKSVWIVGGDGWAYDIGYGGLDHVIASGKNVNILVLDNEVYDNTGGQASKATPYGAEATFAFGGKNKQKKDLGLMAMSYDNVYVASVAIGADQEQTLKVFNEAESYDGPSIIIAYCHSDSHGIDMKRPSQYHKAAVNSGQWILYRNDPRKSKTFQLDSGIPSLKVEDYLRLENRFSKLFKNEEAYLNQILRKFQKQVDNRFNKYLIMTSSGTPDRAKLTQNNKVLKSLK